MKIYNASDGLILDVAVDDTSYRYRVIMGDHNLTLRFSLAEHVEIPVGSYCVFQGQRYTLERPEDFNKIHSRNYDYTITFQSAEFKARIWKFRNPVDGRLKFPLTAKPKEHLQMFIDNMNRRDTGWTIGNCIEGEEVLINYDHDFCRDALAKMASELKTEYHFDGKRVSLCKLEVNKDKPLPLSYGRGHGFKTGVGRSNSGDNPPTEILYVQGGTDNIDRSKYPPLSEPNVRASSGGCLLLPRNATLQFDGEHFEGEDGFTPSLAHTYVTDDLGLSLRRADKELSSLAEDSLDCSSIYPKRVGKVGEVFVTGEKNDLYDFVDSTIPDNLDYSECKIGEETMTIIFQSGMLAGKEFDVRYYHEATSINGVSKKGKRFEIVPQEIDGITMPSDCFIPRKDDKYAVFHCQLPDAYINAYFGNSPRKEGAEWEMFRAAVKHLYEAEQLQFTFKGTLDGLWAKKDWENIGGRIVLGGFILFSDNDFEPDGVRVRITGIKDYVNNPHSPEIELSNSTASSSVSTTLKELAAEEVTVAENHKSAVQFTRRRFRDAQETMTMLEKALLTNFTESINPVGVRTMQMLVGDEALQFEFVDGIPADDATQPPAVVNHSVTWLTASKQLHIDGGIIKHLTLDLPKDLTASHAPQAYHYWPMDERTTGQLTDAAQKYYLYAKVPRQGGKGEFSLETEAKQLTQGGYYWLLMGILNSEYDGDRSYVSLYGFTEILPGRVTTERVVSSNGNSWFDMAAESMKLGDALDFNSNGDRKLILRGTLVQSQSGDTEYIGCFRGEWKSTTTYYQGDEVTYFNTATNTTSMYRCVSSTPVTGVAPTNSLVWQVIAQGSQGVAGVSPNTSFKAIAFYRTNATPPTPQGGSFASPVPTNGWSDGVPTGEAKLWMTTRIFSSDGKAPQQAAWTACRPVTDTADVDFEFSSELNPSMPTGHPNTNPEWSNEATDDTIWMATAKKTNGVWGEWQVMRIKGEDGTDGTSIKVKGAFYEKFATRAEYEAALKVRGCVYLIDHDEILDADCVVVSLSTRNIVGVGYRDTFTPAEEGDAWVLNSDGHLYIANGEKGWVDIGQFKGDTGAAGKNGKNAYLHIKYANSLTRGDWTDNNGETPGQYIGLYSDNNVADPACTNANWDLFSWSKWEGRDGFGYEFIYKRTNTATAPTTPLEMSVDDGFVPNGWTDDPTGVDATYQWEWQCYRKKTDGNWGKFIGSASNNSVAALWAKYGATGATGATGDYTEFRYAANGSTTVPPTFNANTLNTSLWVTSLNSAQAAGTYVWQTSARFSSAGVRKTAWTTPVRITGIRGATGAAGSSPVLVFRGDYNSSATYYGTAQRVDAVRHKVGNDTTFFVARTDAGEFKGIAPPDEGKWNGFGATFESVATNLLLAENANIANLIFRNQRLESLATTNGTPNFFIDGLKNIASFAAGKVVFDGTGARVGWIFIDGKDLVGVDNDGVERLRITPNALPSVNAAGKTTDLIIKNYGGDATYIGETSTKVAFEYQAAYDEGQDDGTSTDDTTLYGYVEYDIPENSTRLDLSGLQANSQLKDFSGNAIPYNKITESMTATIFKKNGNSWNTIGYVALSQGQGEITIPAAGRIRVAINLSVYVTGVSLWSGTISVAAQSLIAKTAKEEVFIAKDGLMAIYNANYLRFHSGEGLLVRVGNYGLRITSVGIQKTTNGGSTWGSI